METKAIMMGFKRTAKIQDTANTVVDPVDVWHLFILLLFIYLFFFFAACIGLQKRDSSFSMPFDLQKKEILVP